jgi:hypothetical protein
VNLFILPIVIECGMDIDDIRRANIRTLEKEAGSPRLAADTVEMSYAQFVNYRDGAKEAKTGKVRGMRKETAWRFEDAFGKPRGWLDQDHSAASLPAPDQEFLHRVEQDVARYVVPDHIRAAILTLIEASPLRQSGAAAHDPPPKEAKAA